jgi:hypothetical protein
MTLTPAARANGHRRNPYLLVLELRRRNVNNWDMETKRTSRYLCIGGYYRPSDPHLCILIVSFSWARYQKDVKENTKCRLSADDTRQREGNRHQNQVHTKASVNIFTSSGWTRRIKPTAAGMRFIVLKITRSIPSHSSLQSQAAEGRRSPLYFRLTLTSDHRQKAKRGWDQGSLGSLQSQANSSVPIIVFRISEIWGY